jgi:hypothetical protein
MAELINTAPRERYLTDLDVKLYHIYTNPDGTNGGSDLSCLGLTSLYTQDGQNILSPFTKLCIVSVNKLTSLCELPQGVMQIHCGSNLLTSLPENLPPELSVLLCANNKLKLLPDLPNTLYWVDFTENPLEQNYPAIFTFDRSKSREIVAYVNMRNIMMRASERMHKIDPTNQILEHYMRRAMHPSRLTSLVNDESIDVDEYMTKYVESL